MSIVALIMACSQFCDVTDIITCSTIIWARKACVLAVFRRPFVQRFALCFGTIVCLVCLSVCNVSVFWRKG